MRKLALSLYKQLKPVDVNSNKLFLVYDIHEWKLDFELTIYLTIVESIELVLKHLNVCLKMK